MANIKSAKKRIRVSERNRKRNLVYKNKVKKLIKAARSAKSDQAKKVSEAVKWIDKAAKKKIIHKNKASRWKSRLMKLLK